MKLNQIKNLGKELTKEELNLVKGGDLIIYYSCTRGGSGSIRGNSLTTNFGQEIANACGLGGGFITYVKGSEATSEPTDGGPVPF
ncbi:hypothetical protein CXF68_13760 [Tenacibaculum sp. Bg11-29]|uniref:hypothetical protein n=1 Tax=Tenacibaculum sp. Bg11-29 TaxID=2058306 RepID=UPI000C33B913|nr:hypothetical protein [Tenacibaculum sp. Bg11-29]PKH51684.1 hypothetical protein CXF68_13760 [Tenacibaculum sp. Bg11-29]